MAQAVLLNAVDVPFTASSLMPDNGLASLAACLADAGHEALVWDLGTVKTVRDHVSPEPLPYSLDGRPFEELARLTSQLTGTLRGHGIITNMSDDMVLIAAAAGEEPAELQRQDHQMFVTADAERLEQLITTITRNQTAQNSPPAG